VDVPNSIDEEWNTDIKKTSMDPPPRVMDSLRKLLDKFHDPSKKIYKKRASDKLKDVEIWERYEQQKDLNKPDLSVSFEVNKKSDRYKKIFDKLDKKNQKIFGEFINYLEDELPAQQISIDVIDGKID
jgi:mRNA-degrading endonuclease RelE of RelBE toxin-antitoxin system